MNGAASQAIAANPWLAQSVEIAGITPELPGIATYHLRFRDVPRRSSYRYRPGQFNMLYVPGIGEVAISISSGDSGEGTLDHTIRMAGNVTAALARLAIGSELGLRGPYGSSWPLEESAGADLIVIAGGIGLAPLRPVLEACVNAPGRYGQISLLYGARDAAVLLYTRQYDDWTARGVQLQTTVDRAAGSWNGNVGVVPQLLDRLRRLSPANSVLMACGPEVMMRYTVRSALERGLRKDQIWVSLERNMQCAVGLCGHCQLGPAFVCKDGPIFRYDTIEPFLNVEGL